jgi:hypothetical protein
MKNAGGKKQDMRLEEPAAGTPKAESLPPPHFLAEFYKAISGT